MSAAPWRARVLTLFPDAFPGALGVSLAKKARDEGVWALETLDIRRFARDKHGSVDDTPFGGGVGMVMRPDVVADALDAARGDDAGRPLLAVYLSPRGRPFDQAMARAWAAGPGVAILCGRYEGVDARVIAARGLVEVSLGDFVLSGGEAAAIAMIDACVRLLPGVVGDAAALEVESFEGGLLEHSHYTRPRVWEGREPPQALLSGDHARIAAWRRAEAERATRERRPDLWAGYEARRLMADPALRDEDDLDGPQA